VKATVRVPRGLGIVVLLVGVLCVSCGGEPAKTPGSGLSSSVSSPPVASSSPGVGPLLSLLAGIPEAPISQAEDFVYFVDYSAMESAYDAVRPADAEEFGDLSESGQGYKAWWVLFRGIAWSISDFWLPWLEDGPGTVGFSPLEVDRAIHFGVPPGDGLMLEGSFDADAISAAYETNLGLVPKDFDGRTVWLWGEDPADGLMTNSSEVVPENPFGGYLGRRQPMIISGDLLMSSADLGLVLAHADAATGAVPNLADAPGYRAAVNAVSEDADLLQAAIAGPIMAAKIAHQPVGGDPQSSTMPGSTLEVPVEDQRELPAFQLLILGDVLTSDEQIARVGLVYQDVGSAEIAGVVLLDRLATLPSVSGRPFVEMLTPPDGTGARYYVRQGSDRAVLVLEFPAPRATLEQVVAMLDTAGHEGTVTSPGSIYRRLVSMFAQRDTGWLSAAVPTE